MKNFSRKENCVALDRLATWDEVRCAMAFWSQGASELGSTLGGHHDPKSEAAGSFGVFSKKLAWLALISEGLNRKCN
jgi:hypothetical protein